MIKQTIMALMVATTGASALNADGGYNAGEDRQGRYTRLLNEVNSETVSIDRLRVIEEQLVREGNLTNLPAKAREKRLTLSCEINADKRYNITKYSRYHGDNFARLAPPQNERIIRACIEDGIQQGETTLTRVGGGAYDGKQVIFWKVSGELPSGFVNTDTTVGGGLYRGDTYGAAFRNSADGDVNYGDIIQVRGANLVMEVADGYRQTHHGETPVSVWKGLKEAQ